MGSGEPSGKRNVMQFHGVVLCGESNASGWHDGENKRDGTRERPVSVPELRCRDHDGKGRSRSALSPLRLRYVRPTQSEIYFGGTGRGGTRQNTGDIEEWRAQRSGSARPRAASCMNTS